MNDVYLSKLYVFSLLTVCRLVFGLSPLFVSRKLKRKHEVERFNKSWVEKCVAYSMDFSGGILLATCFIHMIPEVREHLMDTMNNYNFPYAETLVCIGFFIVFVIEESVKHVANSASHNVTRKSQALISEKAIEAHSVIDGVGGSRSRAGSENRDRDGGSVGSADTNGCGDNVGNGTSTTTTVNNGLILEMNSMMKDELNECNNNMKGHNAHNLKNFLLVAALSFHSVMEGLAIGLARSVKDVWYLFLAVAVHECTILLCVGIELVATCPSTSVVIAYMAVFTLISPAGVLFGTLISEPDSSQFQKLMIGSLQGLAAGTILYVTFFEVLNNHKHHHHHRGKTHQSKSGLPKLIFIAFGFIFMIILEINGGHDDEHNAHKSSNKSSSLALH